MSFDLNVYITSVLDICMTLCNICLKDEKTTALDRLQLCKPCLKEVKNRLKGNDPDKKWRKGVAKKWRS